MFDGTSRSDPHAQACGTGTAADGAPRSGVPMAGALELAFRARGKATEVGRLHQQAPCRALFPRTAAAEPRQAIVINIAGGLVGGDTIGTSVRAEAGTRAVVTSQAAEKVYRSGDRSVRIDTAVAAAADARLEWMPQPTILFDGADLVRHTRLDVASTAVAMAGEITILGRAAHGERLRTGRLFDEWTVHRDGRLIWADRTRVDDWPAVLDDPHAFGGARATALAVYAASDAAARVDEARSLLDAAGVLAGATVIDGLLVLRWLGREASRLVVAYADFWRRFRARVGLGAPVLPTIWQT